MYEQIDTIRQKQLIAPRKALPKGLRFLLIAVLVIGVFFRFANLEKKLFWIDETDTLIRISGYTKTEVAEQVFDGNIIGLSDLNQYQSPNSEKNLVDTFRSLAEDVHPPLYFILARFWMQIFGDTVAVARGFSVFLSLLVLPCLYWLCLEIFDFTLVGWMAVTIVAISPFHVLYAQEARMYSLWTLEILLSSVLLLRATRLKTKASWALYAIATALSFYTHIFSVLVTISHGIYLFISEKFRFSRSLAYYLTSLLASVILYSPWLLIVLYNWQSFQSASSWISKKTVDLSSLLISIFHNTSHAFVDFWYIYTYNPEFGIPNLRFGVFIKPLLLILIGYSIYFLYQKASRKAGIFIATLILITPLFLLVRDLTALSGSSAIARYFIPSYLGMEISIAYLLATKLRYISNSWRGKFWPVVTVLLISGGIISCLSSFSAESWSNKYTNNEHQIANTINRATNPLVVSDQQDSLKRILSLSHHLDSKVRLQLLDEPEQLSYNANYSDVFLFSPSQSLRKSLKGQKYQLSSVPEFGELWRLKK